MTTLKNPNNFPVGITAGGVVVRQENGEWLIALEQQIKMNGKGWCLPKGHVEAGEDLATAAKREIAEEAGVTEFESFVYLCEKQRESLQKKEWKILHYFLAVTKQIELNPQGVEKIHRAQWFPLFSDLPLVFEEQKEAIEEVRQKIQAGMIY